MACVQDVKKQENWRSFAEYRIGKFIADIYLKKEKFWDIVFEIQGTNYSALKYDEKIISYAFRKLLVVYLFIGDGFYNEVKRNIYSLKEIEKRIFINKTYCDTVFGCYLNNEYVTIPSFKEKYAKGGIGHCTHRFIMDYNKTRQLLLSDYLDDIIQCHIREPFKPPECNHNEIIYEKYIGKLVRYKKICLICGKFIGWLSNAEAKAKGFTFNRD